MKSSDSFKLAQLSDVHLGPLPPFWPGHWNMKRALGFVNFWTKRRSFNDPALVHALVDDLKEQAFDHIAVTGDLANLGMPSELAQSLEWLKRLGSPNDVTVIPGNHDIYAKLVRDPGVERWRAYMCGRGPRDEVAGLPAPLSTGFPFVRIFGNFALININSAVPTPPAVASGRVGEAQCARFVAMSRVLHQAGLTRVVTIHHPPLAEHGPRGLTDASAFEHALLEAGGDIVLHGHNHRSMISWRDTATGPAPIIGAGSAGEGVYNLYHFQRQPDGTLAIEVAVRRAKTPTSGFAETARVKLNFADPHRQEVI